MFIWETSAQGRVDPPGNKVAGQAAEGPQTATARAISIFFSKVEPAIRWKAVGRPVSMSAFVPETATT